jgi:plasmid stability protein
MYNACMANVQIRDVPPDLHRRLKAQAGAAGQSLNQFLLDRLSEIAGTVSLDELTAEIRRLPPYEGPSIAAIIREERDSR